MTQAARQADAVIQELWRIKDAAFEAAGHDPKRFVQQLRERSSELRNTVDQREAATVISSQFKPQPQ